MINPGVVAAIRVIGVRGDTCGAMHCIDALLRSEHVGVPLNIFILF